MKKRYRVFLYIAFAIEVILLTILQQTPNLIPAIFGVRPLPVIPAVVTIAMTGQEQSGMWFGVGAGLLLDLSFGSVIGFYAILLGLFGFFCGLLSKNLIRNNFLTALLFSFVTITATLGLHFVFFYLLAGYGSNGYAFVHRYLPLMLYTFATTPVFYFLNKLLALKKKEREAPTP